MKVPKFRLRMHICDKNDIFLHCDKNALVCENAETALMEEKL